MRAPAPAAGKEPPGKDFNKDVSELYETGKHRRYALLFAVNGGGFAIGRLMVETGGGPEAAVLGGLELWMLSLAMALFTGVMTYDIWMFGERMRAHDASLFRGPGRVVLALIGALLALAWIMVARPA